MTTMVEKVARAIADGFTNGNVQFDEEPPHHQRSYLEAARAAIEAMKPDSNMDWAGVLYLRENRMNGTASGCFEAMIQAALKEGQ